MALLGNLSPKFEHAARFFAEIGYTLYGIIAEFDARDLKDSVFEGIDCRWDETKQKFGNGLSGAEAKRKILEMFEKKGEQPVVTIDFLYISADLQHDPAFVQHVNDKLCTLWLKANGVNGEATFKIHLVDSDGCPNQFDLAPQYLWIAGQQMKTGIRMDWTLNCPCHGKAKSDQSCGEGKEMVAAEQLLHTAESPTRVDTAEQAAEVMCISYLFVFDMHTHARMHARTHTRTHARTHARTGT
jgi:hypothetical protein